MKDYSKWHEVKTVIENHHLSKYFREREVWWCALGLNVGSEQDGKNKQFSRPVLIIKKFNQDMFWGIPLTSHFKEDRFHFQITIGKNSHSKDGWSKPSCLVLSQLKLYSSKRLERRFVRISKLDQHKIIERIISLFL